MYLRIFERQIAESRRPSRGHFSQYFILQDPIWNSVNMQVNNTKRIPEKCIPFRFPYIIIPLHNNITRCTLVRTRVTSVRLPLAPDVIIISRRNHVRYYIILQQQNNMYKVFGPETNSPPPPRASSCTPAPRSCGATRFLHD